MSNRVLIVIAVLVVLVIAAGVAFYTLRTARGQALAWVYPGRTQPEQTPEQMGLTAEDVRITTADGIELTAWFVPASGERDTDGATVIFLHGLGGNRGALLPQAAVVVEQGYNALLLDLRNHGDSGGTITTIGYREGDDLRVVVDYLLTRSDVNAERIAVIGHSLGAVAALRGAAQIPEIRAVVSESGFSSIAGSTTEIVMALTGGNPPSPSAGAVLWFVDQETGVPASQVRSIDDVVKIAPRPILFIHGEQDTVINVRSAQEMYDAAADPKELYLVANAGHSDLELMNADAPEFERRVLTFLDTHLLTS